MPPPLKFKNLAEKITALEEEIQEYKDERDDAIKAQDNEEKKRLEGIIKSITDRLTGLEADARQQQVVAAASPQATAAPVLQGPYLVSVNHPDGSSGGEQQVSVNPLDGSGGGRQQDWVGRITEQFQDIQFNSINLGTNHYLKRDSLVEKLKFKVLATPFTLISSPPSTGKTSLIKLFVNKFKYNFIFVQCVDNIDPFELFRTATGIDLHSKKIDETIPKNKVTLVIIDDAQCFYSTPVFWTYLLKYLPDWIHEAYKIRFIISATHNITILSSSPEGFGSIPKISNVDLKLSAEESHELISLTFRKSHFILSQTVKDSIVSQCGGVIGAVTICVTMIADKFAQHKPTDTDILQYICSGEFISCLSRVYGTSRDFALRELQEFLSYCMIFSMASLDETLESIEKVVALEKMGVLLRNEEDKVSFTSALAKRYYTQYLFPNRAHECPETIQELVKLAIANMSSALLTKSTISKAQFPKEAVFQHIFMSSLAMSLPVSNHICPELSHIFPSSGTTASDEKVEGEIDFYINGTCHWGLELLIKGGRIKEHMSRFEVGGKYHAFGMKDYRVIDFRISTDGTPTEVDVYENKITVFFAQKDFSKCSCIFGLDKTPVKIGLLP